MLQLVPRQDLNSAVAANSVGINISRAIGPALAGILVAAIGNSAPSRSWSTASRSASDRR
ncbi:MAG TPA: MFS transporter [Hyphomicrobiaceae bacterium]|nr:MFS transporter [Hyphomicrobiaceae bacterium]